MKRILYALYLLLFILPLSACAQGGEILYDRPSSQFQVAGSTTREKFQSIAKIVSDSHKGSADVAYVDFNGQPGFMILLKGSVPSSSDPSTQSAAQSNDMQQQASALAQLLRLTAVYVLPTEPSIQFVVFEVNLDGQRQILIADAAELKALPSDAPDRAWLVKLQVMPPSSSATPSSGP